MKIEYELNKQDYIAFNVYHAENSDVIRKSLLMQRYLVPVIYLVFSFLFAWITKIPLWYCLAVFIVLIVLWIAFYPRYFMSFMVKRVSKIVDEGKNKDMLGRHSITVDETGLAEETENGESKIKWDGVERIVTGESHFFIYISSVSAYIVPKRAFQNEKLMDEFFQFVGKMLENKKERQ